MALKSIIDKATFEKLPEPIQAEYKADGDNYVLDISGLEDHPQAGALKRAKDRVKEELDTAREELKAAKSGESEQLKQLQDKIKDLEKSGDNGDQVEKLRSDYEKKLAKQKGDFEKQVQSKDGHIKELLVSEVARGKAAEWSRTPSLLAPQIESRLTVEYDEGGKPTTRVLDKDGNISAMSIEDLKAEIYSNKEYEPILIGSRADGSSAPNHPGGGNGGGSAPNGDGSVDPEKLSPKDLAARVKQRQSGQYEGV